MSKQATWGSCRLLRSNATRIAAVLAAAMLIAATGGCGWLAYGLAGGKRKVNVKAQYLGLNNHSIAVLTLADEYVLFEYPKAPSLVTVAVSSRIAADVPGVTVMDPRQVVAYQNQNPYWATLPDGELIRALGVDRLVRIDLAQYRTHEPGNSHVWQGMATANVSVIEADAPNPNNPVFRTTVESRFPEDTKIGVLNTNDQTIQLGLVKALAEAVSGLFHDHQIEVEP
ncbi:MAG TPA: hypothetical protein VF184_00820 [Phycisphaeraceae bacterium]